METLKIVQIILVVVLISNINSIDAKQTHKKVLILGAGLSGIVASKTLSDKGIDDFLILEGQGYVGGRIKQVEIAGYKIEKGANWIHFYDDKESAPLWNAKLKNNLRGIVNDYSNLIIRDENGKNVTNKAAYNKLIKIFGNVEDAQEKRKKDKKPLIPARVGLSLMGWKPKTQAEYSVEYLEIDFENSKKAELTPFQGIFEKGGDFFATDERGIWNIYEEMYTSFKDKIKLNTTVTGIKYNSSIVQVTTSDGEVYTADYALCTFSTGVLASDMVTFTPTLPEWKQEAILTMPMAVYTKIYVKFHTKFWDDKEFILYAGSTRQSIAVFQDLQRPGIYPNNSGLLLVTFTGDEGRRVEKQSFEDTKTELVKMLKGVYGSNISEPTDIYYPRWTQNKFVRGSYSEGTVGMTSKTFENLAKNLGNLYFSGEATSEDWYGYMQGAYFTGENQAKSIVKANDCKEKPQNCNVSGADSFRACPAVVSTTFMLIWLFKMVVG